MRNAHQGELYFYTKIEMEIIQQIAGYLHTSMSLQVLDPWNLIPWALAQLFFFFFSRFTGGSDSDNLCTMGTWCYVVHGG